MKAMKSLEPDSFFRRAYIEKKAAQQYEAAVKQECNDWIKAGMQPLLMNAITVRSPTYSLLP